MYEPGLEYELRLGEGKGLGMGEHFSRVREETGI